MHGCCVRHRSARASGWGPLIGAALLFGWLLQIYSVAQGVGLSLAESPHRPPLPQFDKPKNDTVLVLDLGNLLDPHRAATAPGKDAPMFTLLGSPSSLYTTISPLSLDLRTFRAFRSERGIIDSWNRETLALMSRPDQEKRGELRIGVELPAAVRSIVGEGDAGLKVSGYQRILFSGRSQWTDATAVASIRQNKFPSLTMDQVSRFTVEGTIGTKVSVKVDQDSQRQTDLENRLMLRYHGDEDDILKSVEAGNTTLSLPNTQFVGYSQRIQGLFGLKATAQLGPVDFTMITSQEKGNSVRNRVTAGANEQVITIRDYQYARNRFFDLGYVAGERFLNPGDTIVYFELFEYVSTNPDYQRGGAYADIRDTTRFENYEIHGSWRPLTGDPQQAPRLYPGNYIYLPFRPQSDTRALAYYMQVRRAGASVPEEFGSLAGTYRLQLLKTANSSPSDPLWGAEWKNVYDLRIRNITYEEFKCDIFRGKPGTENTGTNDNQQDGVPYLQLLGLDVANQSGAREPDGLVDRNPAILDLEAGLLIFPNRRPFDPQPDTGYAHRFPGARLDPKIPSAYNSNLTSEQSLGSEYYIQITTRQRSTTISLGQINIMPESEVVTLNGNLLLRGSQYRIDYALGQIEFLDDRVLDPNATLTIDYEYAPFLSIDRKTLFGLRSEYAPGPNFRTGATFLYKGSKATDRPAQLGQEPFRDIVLDYDVFYKSQPSIMTKMADALPLVNATAPSNLTVAAEVARSMPNPNTRGEVFIDDFESVRQAYSLGILRESYAIASPPLNPVTLRPRHARGFQDPAFIWHNPYTQFAITDVYARQVERQSDDRMHVLVLTFDPRKSRMRDSVATLQEVWGGAMRGLPKTAEVQSRAEFLELRMAVRANDPSALGTLHIDLGRISEDVNLNGVLDTEDRVGEGGIRNGILDEGEDTGLDGLFSHEEPGYDPVTNPDPNGDDWHFDRNNENDVSRINGTEGNGRDFAGGRPDTENLRPDQSEFNVTNSYYSFAIDLANPDPRVLVEGSEYARRGFVWKTYRIPLWDAAFYQTVGSPDSTQIQYYRIWLDNASDSMQIYIAAVDLVENRWKGELIPAVEIEVDTTSTGESADAASVPAPSMRLSASVLRTEEPGFLVAVKNTESDVGSYEPPPGVSGYRDPTTNVREKEQSISLEYLNFISGDTGKAVYSNPTAQDFTGYRFLKMFVHGADDADGKTLFYLRFGQSPEIYYEYRDTVFPGWDPNNVEIDFNYLTALKEETRRLFLERGITVVDTFDVGRKVGVKGLPSLARVSYMEMGLVRLGDAEDMAQSGEVWCDELRLTDVRKDPGMAARATVTAGFSDLMGFTATVHAQDYAFRSLNAGRTGSVINASSQLNTDIRANIALSKFLPDGAGLSLPVSVNYQRRVATPKLLTNSDVVLSDSLQKLEQTTSLVQGISTSIRWMPPINHWLPRSTIGGLSGQFSVNRSEGSSPTVPGDTATGYSAGAGYTVQFKERLTFPALFWSRFLLFPRRVHGTQFSLLPMDFAAQGTVSRAERRTINRNGLQTYTYNRSFNGSMRSRLQPIPAVTVNYNMATMRDLSDPDEVRLVLNYRDFNLGKELQFSQRLSADYKPTLFNFFSPSFGYSADFTDRIDILYGDHDVDVTRRWSVNGTFDLKRFWAAAAFGRGTAARPRRPPTPRAAERRLAAEPEDRVRDAADTTGRPQVTKREDTGPGLGPGTVWRGLIRGLDFVTSPIEPVSLTFSRQNADSRNNLRYRPPRSYQFGLDLYQDTVFELMPGAGAGSAARTDAFTETDAFSAKNNFRLTRFLQVSSQYSYGVSKRQQPGYLPNRTRSQTFPSLSTQLGQLEKIRPIRWIFVNASVRTGYTYKRDESFVGDSLTNKTSNEGFSPLFSVTGQTKQGIRVTLNRDQTSALSRPSLGNTTKRQTSATRLTLDYSFRSPHGIPFPLLRSLRLNSQLTMSLSILRRNTESFTAAAGTDSFVRTQSSEETSIEPRMNYSFSSRVKGGLTARWTDTKDTSTGGPRKTHIRELGIWAEFSF